jgi:hypothetical protein
MEAKPTGSSAAPPTRTPSISGCAIRTHVVGLDAAAIKNADGVGGFLAELLAHLGADGAVGVGGDLGCRGLAGADGPHGLIGNHDLGELRRVKPAMPF